MTDMTARVNQTIANAAAVIREVSPFLADMFISRPFHRTSVVSALFEKMKADGNEGAYRTRIVLNRALEAVAYERRLSETDQL